MNIIRKCANLVQPGAMPFLLLLLLPSCVASSLSDFSQEHQLMELSKRILAIETRKMAATDRGKTLLERSGVDFSLPIGSLKPDRPMVGIVRVVLIPSQSEWDGVTMVLTYSQNYHLELIEAIARTNLVRFGELAESDDALHFRSVPDGDYHLIGMWRNMGINQGDENAGEVRFNWASVKVTNGELSVQPMVEVKRVEMFRPVWAKLE